ncbi:uncharacterized protein LOC129602785 isoform X2 [Paramacrobiotus metropolitanus]|uniref:uncharacterized protein LOC129602785 isoform X2 n=1 Tax=Paramacrobiotus metropolitanus TaxID=2943436 RepID=UPI002445A3B4|nr:uncharacterized protein LOC129602785 isoform X2 [Paramacrobiotus metropolitanus]
MPPKPVADAGVNRSTQDSLDTGYLANLRPMLPVSDGKFPGFCFHFCIIKMKLLGFHYPFLNDKDMSYTTLSAPQPIAAVDIHRSPSMDSQPSSSVNASGPSKSVLATKNVAALDIQRFPGGIACGVELNKSVDAISNGCESVLCDEDFPPSSGTSPIPSEMSKSMDIQVVASENSSGAALPAIQNSGRDIPYSVPPEVATGASSSAFAPGRINHLRAITSVSGVRDVVAKNRYGMDIHSDAPPLVIREENPRIIRHQGGYKKFIWYWQAKAEGTVQLRRGYDIYVYTTILDDCKMKHPIWNPKTYTAHAWEIVQHLMGGDEGIIACYENRYDNQGVDFLLGRNTMQAVLGYVTELYKLQQPMKELTAFKAMINTRLLQLFRSRKQSMSGASKAKTNGRLVHSSHRRMFSNFVHFNGLPNDLSGAAVFSRIS